MKVEVEAYWIYRGLLYKINIMNYKLKLKRIELEKTSFGYDIVVKMVQVFDENGKFLKNAKLNQELVDVIKSQTIEIKE